MKNERPILFRHITETVPIFSRICLWKGVVRDTQYNTNMLFQINTFILLSGSSEINAQNLPTCLTSYLQNLKPLAI